MPDGQTRAAPGAHVRVPPPRRAAVETTPTPTQALVPRPLRIAAAIGWRLLVVAAALFVLGAVVAYLSPIVVPVAIALLLAALLDPLVHALVTRRVPRGVATALVVIGGLAVLGGLLTFVVMTFVSGAPQLGAQLATSVAEITQWLTDGPLRLSPQQLGDLPQQLLTAVNANQASIATGALTTAATIGELFTEILLMIFTLIFFLYGGSQIWGFLTKVAPRPARSRVDVAGRRGLAALVSYTRATAAVAVVDAVAIGLGVGLLGVPLALPLAALVLLGAFVPIIGAVVAGGVAVLVALVSQGFVSALIVLAIVIAVMQLESHILQPLLLGRAVKLHPLAVVLAVGTGLLVGGIAGALLAVPLLAVLNSGIRSLLSPLDRHVAPEDVHTSEPEDSGPADIGLEREADL